MPCIFHYYHIFTSIQVAWLVEVGITADAACFKFDPIFHSQIYILPATISSECMVPKFGHPATNLIDVVSLIRKAIILD